MSDLHVGGRAAAADASPDVPRYSRTYVLYAVGILFLVSVFNVVDRYVLSILAGSIKGDLELSDTQIGLLLGPSFSVVHFLTILPAAWLADRTARRSVIAVGLFVWSAMTALGGLAQSFTQLFLARMASASARPRGPRPLRACWSIRRPPRGARGRCRRCPWGPWWASRRA